MDPPTSRIRSRNKRQKRIKNQVVDRLLRLESEGKKKDKTMINKTFPDEPCT